MIPAPPPPAATVASELSLLSHTKHTFQTSRVLSALPYPQRTVTPINQPYLRGKGQKKGSIHQTTPPEDPLIYSSVASMSLRAGPSLAGRQHDPAGPTGWSASEEVATSHRA